jgi:putative phosphoesterase
VGVISDTHIPSRAKALPEEVLRLFGGVALILHAGDVSTQAVLASLGALAPVTAVAGNVEDSALAASLPEAVSLSIGGLSVGMVHNSGQSVGRRERMRSRFPHCRVVVYGHSHLPLVEDRDGLLLLNPGSACDPRRARIPTVAILEIAGDQPRAQLVPLGLRAIHSAPGRVSARGPSGPSGSTGRRR